MKKLFTIAFAAVLFAAWTVPAQAEITGSGQLLIRGEYYANAEFGGDDVNGDNISDNAKYMAQRLILNFDAKPTEDVSVHASLIQARLWGDSSIALTGSNDNGGSIDVDVHEAYALVTNIFGTPVHMKAGRQEINLGAERIIGSDAAWAFNPLALDALAFVIPAGPATIIAADVKIADSTGSSDTEAGDADLYVLYAIVPVAEAITLDVYAMQLIDGGEFLGLDIDGDGKANTVDLLTYGLRVAGAAGPVDFDVEVTMQTGSITANSNPAATDLDLEGMAYAVDLGFNVNEDIRIGLGYDYASGESDDTTKADKTLDGFISIAPSYDKFLGFHDIVDRENIEAFNVNASAKFGATSVSLAYFMFTLAETGCDAAGANCNDGWAGDGNVANGIDADEDDLGTEIDLLIGHEYNEALSFELGYSLFQAGDRIDGDQITGNLSTEDSEFAYLSMAINF